MLEDAKHSRIALLTLSGTPIQVGVYDSGVEPSPVVYFQTDENAEPIYIKGVEAMILVATLQAAIDFTDGNF